MKIQIEGAVISGSTNLEINTVRCVCGHCGNNDNKNAIIEFNFQEQKIIYLCSQCKKENSIQFGKEKSTPYPRIGVSR